jgi:putative tricarboxylic transport membrane protein
MEPRSSRDFSSGVGLAALGLYMTIAAARLSYISEDGPGPGFLPFWLGIAICTLAVCLVVVNQLRPTLKARDHRHNWSAESRALSGWLALMVAILLLASLGFTISLVLLSLFFIWFMERRSLWVAVIVALGLGIGFHLIFVVALGLSLPQSPLGF